jgi:hypothetical protein
LNAFGVQDYDRDIEPRRWLLETQIAIAGNENIELWFCFSQ